MDVNPRPHPHAIMISVPYQGHINPFVNLALKLASKGFSITFVHIEFVHQTLSKAHHHNKNEVDFFSQARESGLDIRYTTINDGFPVEFDRVIHFEEYWESILQDFSARVDEFIEKTIKSDPFSAHFIVADTSYSWPATIAKKYNLVNVSFWTEPALVFSLIYHLDLLRENGHCPCKDNIDEEINYLPGVESISTKDIMPYLKESESKTIVYTALSTSFQLVKNADFILHNTIQELEPTTLSSLNKNQPNYAIGPINFSKINLTTTITKSLWSESNCANWLDSKPPNSVLYVSFGSLVQTNKQVIEEIARGLLLSEVNFVWVVRAGIVGSNDSDVLPDGFIDEVKEKGLIVPWCDQITVLSSPAVGGFLTHCGWNSILESMWCGVPMICYPVTFDQPTNRKLVVDDWKIGVNLCDDGLTMLVDRVKVAEKVRSFMCGSDEIMGLKEGIKKVREVLHGAMEIGGSTEGNFDKFVDDLRGKIYAKSMDT